MRLHTAAFAVAVALVWGAAVLLAAILNLIVPPYAGTFLQFVASIYPGYHPGAGVGSVIVGTVWALLDGAVGGFVFAWLYNLLARKFAG